MNLPKPYRGKNYNYFWSKVFNASIEAKNFSNAQYPVK